MNVSLSSNSSSPSHLASHFGACFAFFFVAFGLFANFLVVNAILSRKELRSNIVNIFIVSLQLNDLFNICFNQFLVGLSYVYIKWYKYEIMCEIFVYTSIICTGSLLWHHSLISIHRYLVVVRNQSNSFLMMSPKFYCFVSLVLARLIPILVTLPALLDRHMTVYVGKTLRCMLNKSATNQNKLIFIFNIILPCLIIMICFARIFSRVREVSKRISKKKQERNPTTKSSANQKEIKITKMFGLIFLVFLFGYFPYGLVRSYDKDNSLNADIYVLLTVLFIVSISVSPVIYGLMNKKIKMQCKIMLNSIVCCRFEHKSNELKSVKSNKVNKEELPKKEMPGRALISKNLISEINFSLELNPATISPENEIEMITINQTKMSKYQISDDDDNND